MLSCPRALIGTLLSSFCRAEEPAKPEPFLCSLSNILTCLLFCRLKQIQSKFQLVSECIYIYLYMSHLLKSMCQVEVCSKRRPISPTWLRISFTSFRINRQDAWIQFGLLNFIPSSKYIQLYRKVTNYIIIYMVANYIIIHVYK